MERSSALGKDLKSCFEAVAVFSSLVLWLSTVEIRTWKLVSWETTAGLPAVFLISVRTELMLFFVREKTLESNLLCWAEVCVLAANTAEAPGVKVCGVFYCSAAMQAVPGFLFGKVFNSSLHD